MSVKAQRQAALDYLGGRTGRLEYRFIRYGAVADELQSIGMDDSSLLMDLGAGMCDFDFYLRTVRGWKGRYLPVDRAIDGGDLDEYIPPWSQFADFVTAIEVLEHLERPGLLAGSACRAARVGAVFTTPNTDVLGVEVVREMDPTHISPLTQRDLEWWGFDVKVEAFFGQPQDSLLATWRR